MKKRTYNKKVYLENDYYIKPSFYDLDPMGVVWHGNYVKFMEQAREAMLSIIDYDYDIMTAKGVMWPIVKLEIKYINSIKLNQRVRIHTEITEYLNGMKTEYTFYDENNKIISKSSTLQMPIDSETRKSFLNSPKDFVERIEKLNKL
ncbi:acyl-CoA thioesterase [Brachyspira sp. G79]|uniref:acyl-CoA thioesterase n=1 Tax=Brachyspira sp. G79 TaxID=1358104 RepID=UPI000BBCF213|nr:acyl-CoA thioesterase [Brachyspira sp. G79]PCG19518.1 esterase [Brachyspira sp. G79]